MANHHKSKLVIKLSASSYMTPACKKEFHNKIRRFIAQDPFFALAGVRDVTSVEVQPDDDDKD